MASATLATGYVPPFARTTTSAVAAAATTTRTTGTSISFAQIATRSAQASGSGSTTSTAVIVDSTGGVDSSSLLEYFTRPYIDAHTLSIPTWRYAYILWFVIVATLIVWSAAYHLSGSGAGGSRIGAWFRKYSIRRITIGGKVKKQRGAGGEGTTGGQQRSKVRWASPTYAQMATIVLLIGVAAALSFAGNDYIAPTTCVFGGECPYSAYYGSSGPPRSTYSVRKRQLPSFLFSPSSDSTTPPPTPAGIYITKRGVNNPNGWAPFNDPLLAGINVDIPANWWSAAARLGLISYAMLPLAVTLVLKQWPFNIWATPFLTNYHFDKTAILHRWSGRVIWLFTTGHVAGWIRQLIVDKDPFGRPVLVPMLQWYRFVAGIIGYGLLTLIVAFSFKPVRTRFYEFFYWSHVILVFLFLATCIVHHKPLMWWPIIAAIWWGAERLVRFCVLLWINGFLRGIGFREPKKNNSRESFTVIGAEKVDGAYTAKEARYPPTSAAYDESHQPLSGAQYFNDGTRSPSVAPSYHHHSSPTPAYISTSSSPASQLRPLPPQGFASAQLLPGRMVRLTIHTATPLRWHPGQHIFLSIPSVRLFEAHPYTITSIDDRAYGIAPIGGLASLKGRGSEVVLLVRAQKGFSKALWEYVVKQRQKKERQGAAGQEVAQGVNLRAIVSWPLGSAARAQWGAYESLLIVCGGAGVTFGISVLEYTCRRLARKDVDGEGKYKTDRVRFVWILREFAHLSWVAPTLRRCYEMVDPSRLEIELFVSRDAPRPSRRARKAQEDLAYPTTPVDEFAPPMAPFARENGRKDSFSRDSMDDSDVSDVEDDSTTRQERSRSSFPPREYEDHVDSVTDLVLFDGEDDIRTPKELDVSTRVRKEGKLRRALSRCKTIRAVDPPSNSASSPSQPLRPDSSYSHVNLNADHEYGATDQQHYSSNRPSEDHSQSPYSYARPDLTSYNSTRGSFTEVGITNYSPSRQTFNPVEHDAQSDVYSFTGNSSIRHLVPGAASHAGRRDDPSTASLANEGIGGPAVTPDAEDYLDLPEADQVDLDVVAELAKTGYPNLGQVMDDEVQRSSGKLMVACCGPNGLNTLVRHLVSDRIDLAKVVKGDPRGQISLVCEDFSF